MLRELELLPMWRLRAPAQTAATIVSQDALPPSASGQAVSAIIPPTEVPVPALAEPLVDTPASSGQQKALTGRSDTPAKALVSEPSIDSAWLLHCLQASDAPSQQLLQNIMRAMQLPAEQIVLHQQPIHHSQVKVRFCLLFGLESALAFSGQAFADISTARGQLLTIGESTAVITHHPHAMLENPRLKKEVWQDICLLLAKKTEAET